MYTRRYLHSELEVRRSGLVPAARARLLLGSPVLLQRRLLLLGRGGLQLQRLAGDLLAEGQEAQLRVRGLVQGARPDAGPVLLRGEPLTGAARADLRTEARIRGCLGGFEIESKNRGGVGTCFVC